MAELYFPFASSNGDRMVGVETYERMLGSIFTQGVFPRGDMLAVRASGNMELTVATGSAILVRTGVLASLYHNTTPVTLTCAVADGVASRIDTVVLRRDNSARKIELKLLTGVPASQPVAAEPVRTDDYWDLVLCRINIRAGTAEIQQGDIEDCRMDQDLCGIVTSLAQLESGAFYAQQQDLFDRWFAALTATLSGDVAGNLFAYCSDLDRRTDGAPVEIVNRQYTIPADAWTHNAAEMRYEAKIEDPAIQTYTEVEFQLPDSLSGKINMLALHPAAGYMVVHTPASPAESITGTLKVCEVRRTVEEG